MAMDALRWKALVPFEKGAGGDEAGFLRWLGKRDGRESVQARLLAEPKPNNNKKKAKRGGKQQVGSGLGALTKDEARKAVNGLFQAYTREGPARKLETGASKDILVTAVLKNLREGGYQRSMASVEAASRGKVVAPAEVVGDAIKVETHGLVSFDEDGGCRIPREALQDAAKLKALATKALKFVSLVRGTCAPFEEFSKLENALKAATMAARVSEVKQKSLEPLESSFEEERKLLAGLHQAAASTGADAKDILGGHQANYTKAVDETLHLQLALFNTQRRLEVVQSEIQTVGMLAQLVAKAGAGVREEHAARQQQLLKTRQKIIEENEAAIQKRLPQTMQSWYLLTQTYYQHLLDKVYQKGKELDAVFEAVPEDDLSGEDRQRLQGHWKRQYDDCSKLLSTWQEDFAKRGEGEGVTYDKAADQMNAVRNAFRGWVAADLAYLRETSELKRKAGDAMTKVQIVEIDSDDSETEDEGEDEGERGAPAAVDLESFRDLDAAKAAAAGEVASKKGALERVAGAYDRSRLGLHRLALAFLVSEAYSQVVDLYCFHVADKGMESLIEVEEREKQKRVRRERERERGAAAAGGGGAGRKPAEDNMEADDVVIDEAFESFSLFSVLSEDGARKGKDKAGAAKKQEAKPKGGEARSQANGKVAKRQEKAPREKAPREKAAKRKAERKQQPQQQQQQQADVQKAERRQRDAQVKAKGSSPKGANGVEEKPGAADEVDEEEARRLKSVLSKRQAHLSLSVELARAELEAAQKKFEKAQLQLQRFNEIISN